MPVGARSAAHHGNRPWREVPRMTHPAGCPWSSDGRPLMPREPPDERGEQWEPLPCDHEGPHHHEDPSAKQLDGTAVTTEPSEGSLASGVSERQEDERDAETQGVDEQQGCSRKCGSGGGRGRQDPREDWPDAWGPADGERHPKWYRTNRSRSDSAQVQATLPVQERDPEEPHRDETHEDHECATHPDEHLTIRQEDRPEHGRARTEESEHRGEA